MEERLRKFARVVEAGSITVAARELHISQPALSTAIQKLERELHTELLLRGGRSLRPTAAGKLAYDAARELGVISGTLTNSIAALKDQRPTVRLGMIDSVAGILFGSAATIEQFEHHARLAITVNNSRFLRTATARQEVDLAFVTAAKEHGGTGETGICSEPLVVVCHHSRAAAVGDALQEGVLPDFITYDKPSATGTLIDDHLRLLGVKQTPLMFSTSPDVTLRLVILRKGVACLPYWMVSSYIADGTLALPAAPTPVIIERPLAVLGLQDAGIYGQLVRDITAALQQYSDHSRRLLRRHYS